MEESMMLRFIFAQILVAKKEGNWKELDKVLSEVDTDALECGFVSAYLRASATAREHLPEWESLYRRAWMSFHKQGQNPEMLLRGMIVVPFKIPGR